MGDGGARVGAAGQDLAEATGVREREGAVKTRANLIGILFMRNLLKVPIGRTVY